MIYKILAINKNDKCIFVVNASNFKISNQKIKIKLKGQNKLGDWEIYPINKFEANKIININRW